MTAAEIKAKDDARIARLIDEGASSRRRIRASLRSSLNANDPRATGLTKEELRAISMQRGVALQEGEVPAACGVNRATFIALRRRGALP